LAEDGIHIALQPLVNLRSGQVVRFEALARWQHDVRGQIAPATFIPLAEQCGEATALAFQILRQASVHLPAWRRLAPGLRVAVNMVKIDRQFVIPMTTDRRREAIVRATIALGHDLGFEVVAEGVEDRETWELLGALGCDVAQGYHIARPMPAEEVQGWLESWD